MNQLTALQLNDNEFSGTLPSLSKATELNILFMENNRLDGTLPPFTNQSKLVFLSLDNNQFSGSLPVFTFTDPHASANTTSPLQIITLHNNDFVHLHLHLWYVFS
ncbi:kinase [Reticulomyxa filosa]|uniref:Kinase n=1 Tax=Reticulomyxa filosa TaxID=46433 RepID=X6MBM5_RETFI|nr:kinase [Reticulomyxa filosa]|eukprot:ETO11279.1 kinase [Reticulomyxa filosa]